MRALLLLVDGARSVSDIARQAEQLGLGTEVLADLERKGFIARKAAEGAAAAPASGTEASEAGLKHDAERFLRARRFMNETVVDAMGFRSFFFVLKLEKSATLADLRTLSEEYERAIRKGKDEMEAHALVTHAQDLLA